MKQKRQNPTLNVLHAYAIATATKLKKPRTAVANQTAAPATLATLATLVASLSATTNAATLGAIANMKATVIQKKNVIVIIIFN